MKPATTRYAFAEFECMPSGKRIAAASIPGAKSTPTADNLDTLATAATTIVKIRATENEYAYLRTRSFMAWLQRGRRRRDPSTA